MKYGIILTLLLNYSNLFSQTVEAKQKYLSDPKIIWAVEVEKDYIVDHREKAEENRTNRIYTLKQLGITDELSDEPNFSFNKLIEGAIFSNQIKIYADSNLTDEKDSLYVERKDTILSDQNSLPKISYQRKGFDSLYEYRLRAIVFYNEKKANWDIEVLALAPLYNVYDENGNILIKNPWFWLKVRNDKPDIFSKDIIWAKRISDRDKMIHTFKHRFYNSFISIKPIKELTFNHVKDFVDRMEKDSLLKVHAVTEDRLLSWKEKQRLIFQTDTINSDGKIYYITNRLNTDNLLQLRLVHNWFWDDKQKQLFIKLERIGPMTNVVDKNGNYLYMIPYFYRYTED